MKKYLFITIIILIFFTGCKQNQNNKSPHVDLKVACENVIDMEMKGLEVYPNAPSLFTQYKKEKIELVVKAVNGIDYSENAKRLKKITTAFNRLTLDDDSFSYVESGIEKNPYIDLFNSILLREIIMTAKETEIIELAKLKCLYSY